MTEKKKPFFWKNKNIHQDPQASIPRGGLYYTVDPLNISLFSNLFCFQQHQWLCSIVQQS